MCCLLATGNIKPNEAEIEMEMEPTLFGLPLYPLPFVFETSALEELHNESLFLELKCIAFL